MEKQIETQLATEKEMVLFKHGSRWLRADFHFHTRADKEAFRGWDENRSFKKSFVQKLQEEDIRVGVITNHNKFGREEFKALKKEANKHEIFLLPGVELSVGEGNGIHILIVFEPGSWVSGHDDFVNRFLDDAFPHMPRQDRENRNARTQWNLIQTLEKLKEHREHGQDSFVIMAHVDQDNGFCHELNEGRQEELIQHPLFKEFVLGFQKCTTRRNGENLKKWYAPAVPAFVEGCDCKSLETIGRTRQSNGKPQKSFIKIGDFNFYAVKYALMDPRRNMVAGSPPSPQNAYIESVSFETSAEAPLAGITLYLNHNMNNLIGIRGSGKSTILEVIRYALDIKFDPCAKDTDYKEKLVERALRSGGKVILTLRDKHGTPYRIERVFGERPVIYRHGTRLPQFSIDENLISVLYFGQKDLSEVGTVGFSQSLMEKFFGVHVEGIREKIQQKRKKILQILHQLKQLEDVTERKKEFNEEKAALQEKLRIFKEKKVDEKLNRQVQFNKDRVQIEQMIEAAQEFKAELDRLVDNSQDVFAEYATYESSENKDLIEKAQEIWKKVTAKLQQVGTIGEELGNDLEALRQILKTLQERLQKLQDEFAKIKREINIPEINPDDFIKFNKQLTIVEAKLQEVEKLEKKRQELNIALNNQLQDLNKLWHNEFQRLQKGIDELNAKGLSITVELQYKGDKKSFLNYLSSVIKGSHVTSRNLEAIVRKYNDCIEIYEDLQKKQSKLDDILSHSQFLKFREAFMQNLRDLLTYQVPNRYILKYKGKDIAEHSLGQRASALVVFLLARRENDLIIIDQPEDDIDNQSIYEDVIRELNELKDQTQFIFATHNPNIPVLGECEQIFCCRFAHDRINLEVGSIDRPGIQKAIIEIMEGGREAFEQRKRKYSQWKQ